MTPTKYFVKFVGNAPEGETPLYSHHKSHKVTKVLHTFNFFHISHVHIFCIRGALLNTLLLLPPSTDNLLLSPHPTPHTPSFVHPHPTMFSKTTVTALLFLLVLVQSAPPCDPSDPKSLCLKPLKRSNTLSRDPETLSPTLRRRGGGSSGGRGGGGSSGGRRAAGAAAAGAALGSAVAAGRRPRRGRGGFGGDDDDEFVDENGNGIDDDEEDDDFCFPARATVTVQGKGTVDMASLQLRDSVLTTSGYSPVFVFTHRITRGKFPFLRISTPVGALTVSKGHYIYASGNLVTAESVKIGDVLQRAGGENAPVTSIENVLEHGLYNPHTLTGHLVVDGFHVSAYTKTVEPIAANALLTPIRAAFRLFGVDLTSGAFAGAVPKSILNRLPKAAAQL